MRKIVQPLPTIHCKHKPPFPRLALEMNESLRYYSFAELRGQWGSFNELSAAAPAIPSHVSRVFPAELVPEV